MSVGEPLKNPFTPSRQSPFRKSPPIPGRRLPDPFTAPKPSPPPRPHPFRPGRPSGPTIPGKPWKKINKPVKRGNRLTRPGGARVPRGRGGHFPGNVPRDVPKLNPVRPSPPTPKPLPSPKVGGLLFAELLLLVTTSLQERLAFKAIENLPLTDEDTDTDEVSKCYTEEIPPCQGFGSLPARIVKKGFDANVMAITGRLRLKFLFSVPSSRVFMRIHQNAVSTAIEELENILAKGVRTKNPSEVVKRKAVIRLKDVCVRRGKLERGTKA